MNKGRNYQIIFLILASLLCNAAEKMEFTTHITDSHYSPLLDRQLVPAPILKNICLQLVGNDPDEDFKQLLKLRQVSKYFTQREFTENVIKQLVQEKYPATDDILGTHSLSDSAALLVYCSDSAIEWQFKRSNLCSAARGLYIILKSLIMRNIILLMRTKMQANYDIYQACFQILKDACKDEDILTHLSVLLNAKYRGDDIVVLQTIKIPQERYDEFLLLHSLLADETCKTIALCQAAEDADLEKVTFLLQNGADCNAVCEGLTATYFNFNTNPFSCDKPLFKAIDRGNYAVVQLLLNSGANPVLKNSGFSNGLEQALFKRKYEIAELFIKSGRVKPEHCSEFSTDKLEVINHYDIHIIKLLVQYKFNPNDFFKINLNSIKKAFEFLSTPLDKVFMPPPIDEDFISDEISYLLKNNVQFADIQNVHDWAKITMGGNKKAIALAYKYGPKNLSDDK